MVSDLARKLCGTYVEDPAPKAGLLAYFQRECREGGLKEALKRFVEAQSEPLDYSKVVVESSSDKGIQCRIPCRMRDHESAIPFRNDVVFEVDLQDLESPRFFRY